MDILLDFESCTGVVLMSPSQAGMAHCQNGQDLVRILAVRYLSKSIQTVHRLTTVDSSLQIRASLFRDRGIVTKAWNEPGRQAIHGRNVVISLATTSLHTHNSGSQQGQGRDPVTTVPT
jgi:hypothetical protein